MKFFIAPIRDAGTARPRPDWIAESGGLMAEPRLRRGVDDHTGRIAQQALFGGRAGQQRFRVAASGVGPDSPAGL